MKLIIDISEEEYNECKNKYKRRINNDKRRIIRDFRYDTNNTRTS